MKEFQAYGKPGTANADTPRAAAEKFFGMFPTARKCNVVEGKTDGHFFTVSYGRSSEGKRPLSFKDVTKNTMGDLP